MVTLMNHTNLNIRLVSSISNVLADFGLYGWKTHFRSMLIFYWKLLTLPLIAASLDRVALATTQLLHKCFMGWLFVPLLTSTLLNSLGVDNFFLVGGGLREIWKRKSEIYIQGLVREFANGWWWLFVKFW